MLSLTNITKIYHDGTHTVRALDSVSLSATPGEMVSVQGPSGSGKTTLLLIAGGLLAPDSGRVELDDLDVYASTNSERAAFRATSVGFVFQQYHLIPYLDVRSNILSPEVATRREGVRDRIDGLLDELGLADRAHHVPSDLSSGERQRTALARALVCAPRILLADEPTGNLDPDNTRIVLGALRSFTQTGGIVVLATHDPVASGAADRAVGLRHGSLTREP